MLDEKPRLELTTNSGRRFTDSSSVRLRLNDRLRLELTTISWLDSSSRRHEDSNSMFPILLPSFLA